MKEDGHIMMLVYFAALMALICWSTAEILGNQKLIANQNRYIMQVLLCSPIDLTQPIGTKLIKDPNPRKVTP